MAERTSTTATEYPVANAIRERRTIKKFKAEPIAAALLTELLDIAVWAPNHRLREPWRFIAFLEAGKVRLAEAITNMPTRGRKPRVEPEAMRDYLTSIPCHLLVVMPEDPRAREREEDYAAVSALIQNLQLAAWERGIGVIWKTDDYIAAPEFRTAVGVAAGEKVVGLLHLGYPDFVPEAAPRTSAANKLTLVDRSDVAM
ncbi:nitroreductase family protein [Cohnella fermenti]|uniref:Putative NAD(P)H nitroreductase n=1 Tax=Cohnella fermenti TaxID=2565925 RepID=A0A4S4BLY5_9BACL|nr:nitroreductase [Cohnella fermenti]THF75233.1 nitroreductase [Cohnella fermenti]